MLRVLVGVCALFGVVQVAAAFWPAIFGVVAALAAIVLFLLGSALFVIAVVLGMRQAALGRHVDVAGLFLLQGTVPPVVRHVFIALTSAVGAITLVTAFRAPYGLLAVVLPVTSAGVWSGIYGVFPESMSESR
jgi:hypothetical protein